MYIILSTLFLIIVTGLLYVYWILKESHKFFDQYGIPYPKPHWFFGNMKDVVLWKKAIWFIYKDLYDKHVSNRFIGVYTLHTPTVMVRDPELIKSILVKDFSHFRNRGFPLDKDAEPLAENLINMSGDEWKNMRVKLTGAFSSIKMKLMFPLMTSCAENIKPALINSTSHRPVFDVKDICGRLMTDMIGSCAFGIDTHSLQNPESEFIKMGRKMFKFRWQTLMRRFFPKNLPPWLVRTLGLGSIPRDVSQYFMKIVEDMVNYREKNNITRGDFLDLLITLRNQNDEITIEDIAAQCFTFLVAGYEGAVNGVAFTLFELARHPEMQNKLRDEILRTLDNNGGKSTHEMMKQMPYMDMVISETLRLYPFGGVHSRKCTENYKIPNSGVVIQKGALLAIPFKSLHLDRRYFEKPDEYYPEHFTAEAKLKSTLLHICPLAKVRDIVLLNDSRKCKSSLGWFTY
ncbi:probable cytochrome P450 6a18 isoform X3 [Planococcus citri]|uniref:probable cytochrome P450 6a18 isoform X3 n=1 Tax=Planococcus citri TaxID=170843 RepID=UPI0031F98662